MLWLCETHHKTHATSNDAVATYKFLNTNASLQTVGANSKNSVSEHSFWVTLNTSVEITESNRLCQEVFLRFSALFFSLRETASLVGGAK